MTSEAITTPHTDSEPHEGMAAAPEVRILPAIIANKIAAGEVVERPASVVKELIENSLDARAKRITVEIEKGGSDLIRVSDDGHGMSHRNALLSIERFATSKIISDDDLFSIKSFGFRGEAIPSMASVSNFNLTTREEGATSGTRVDISGGKLLSVSETGAPPGTMVEVRNLYFNTPARRKFLKTTNTEMGHIAALVAGFALSAPDVHFKLIHNGRTVKHYSESDDLISRVGTVLGVENLSDLYSVDSSERVTTRGDGLYVTGYITKPALFRSSSSNILLFVNNRMVSDRALVSAILRGYRGRMMKGQFPMAALFIKISSDQVDVNVHPAKLQIRFANQSLVFGAVVNAVHNSLYHGEKGQYDIKNSAAVSSGHRQINRLISEESLHNQREDHPQHGYHAAEVNNALNETARDIQVDPPVVAGKRESTLFESRAAFLTSSPTSALEPSSADIDYMQDHDRFISSGYSATSPEDSTGEFESGLPPTYPNQQPSKYPKHWKHQELPKSSESPKAPGVLLSEAHTLLQLSNSESETSEKKVELRVIGQFANTYIIAESRDGMVLVDQHAAHERVVYERLKKRAEGFKPPSQDMIVPEIVEFNYKEAALLERLIPQLINMGIEIEPFGGTSFVVKSVPAIIDDRSIKPMLLDMVGIMVKSGLEGTSSDNGASSGGGEGGGGGARSRSTLNVEEIGGEWLDSILILMACHSAIRANHPLNQKEMEQLLSDLQKCNTPHHCPHGRPTTITCFSVKELAKRFRRTGN